MSVVVVGSVNLDTTVDVVRLPQPGETLLASGVRSAVGGKGANQAVACARQRVPTAFVGAAGGDPAGTTLLAALAGDGVDVSACRRVAGTPSGQALITVDAGGANTIVVAPGANATLTPDDVAAAMRRLPRPAVVLTQLEIPLETVVAALDAGRACGATTILNPAPARPLPAEVLALCDVIVPNESEATTLSSAATAREAADALAPASTVIVTCGPAGALVRLAGCAVEAFPAIPVTAVDTVAAGDAFCGVLAACLAERRSLSDAVRRAIAAGAHAVTVKGALPSLPTAADVARLLTT